MRNLLTIDVEDYFQVNAFAGSVQAEQWDTFQARVDRNTSRILSLFEEEGVTATFFVLGWVAERFPDLVRRMDRLGHEVASHGYGHQHICGQTPETFREDVRRSKAILEAITGKPVYGYRAPTYSVTNESLWALEILVEEGFRYDSSIFPIHHDAYGIPSAPRVPFTVRPGGRTAGRLEDLDPRPLGAPGGPAAASPGEILEIPIATVRLLGTNLPVAGGGYFRLFPYALIRWGLRRINGEGRPFVFYLHPWEIDPDQPRLEGVPLRSRLRHYTNLGKTEARLRRLLSEFSFSSVVSVYPVA